MTGKVVYDPMRRLARVEGPGGFVQLSIPEEHARAIAVALRIDFDFAVSS